MLRFASSTLPVSTRSPIRASLTGLAACVASLSALAQGELVFVRQPVAQQPQAYILDIASTPDGGALAIEQAPNSQDTLLSKIRRDGTIEWSRTVSNARLSLLDAKGSGETVACGVSNSDVVVLRFAIDGSELWRTVLPQASEATHSLSMSESGDIFVG